MKRRAVVSGVCAALLVTATAIAFASTSSGGRHRVSVIAGPTTTSSDDTAETSTSTSTTTMSPTTATTSPESPSTAAPAPRPAEPGDFSGTLTHYRDMCDVCAMPNFEKGIEIIIRNDTDHPIDLSTSAPVRVAVVCTTNMTPDGHLTSPLPSFPDSVYVDSLPPKEGSAWHVFNTPGTFLAPGAKAANITTYGYTNNGSAPGPAACEAAIVATNDGTWRPETLSVVARLANVPVYSFEVVDPPPTTTTTTAPPTTASPTSTTEMTTNG